jgi:hypothetical protein
MKATIVEPQGDKEHWESVLEKDEGKETSMKKIIVKLHQMLQKYPDAEVTMIRPKPKGFLRQTAQDNPVAFTLDDGMRDTIRDDLEAALKMFEPIHQTVGITPVLEEKENG